jgi:hypothetical protein
MQGLAWLKGEIWVASAKAGRIYQQGAIAEGVSETYSYVSSPVKNPGGLTWTGKAFLVADRLDKVIFQVDPETGLANLVLTLSEIEYGNAPAIFRVKASQVTDVAWGREHLWVTCQAGYSSAVYRIDLEAKAVVQHFRARGPKPEGLSFDIRDEFLWTVDASNQEFSQFTPKGEWTETAEPSPVEKPNGLALDDQDAFWTSDQETGQVYQITREG